MKYLADIHEAYSDPKRLEDLCQAARQEKNLDEFKADLLTCSQEKPDNLLYQAWYCRWQSEEQKAQPGQSKAAQWKLAIPLAILNGLVFWVLFSESLIFLKHIPYLALLIGPITAFFVISFLTFTSHNPRDPLLWISVFLAVATLYVFLLARTQPEMYYQDYLIVMILHLPLLAWIGVGLSVLGRGSTAESRFAFLIKSFEVFITGGVYLIAGGIFGGVTIGMFSALGVELPDVILRLIFAGGGGLIPVLAVASAYDPLLNPLEQDFRQGLSKFVATLMRLLLPLTLAVLIIYIFTIPFNFLEPFKNRDVLIIYNMMLFAVMGLLVGATPIEVSELSPRLQTALRYGIMAVAILAVLVSLYAMSAIVYRTIQGGITINRLTVIGWNTINISILGLAIFRQIKSQGQAWAEDMKAAFKVGTVGYLAWALFLLIVIPIFFR